MIVKCFAVFDVKTGSYGMPFFSATRPSAQRSFIAACSDKNSMLGQHPEDFRLFDLGSFDDSTGIFLPMNPDFVMEGVNPNAA